MVEFPKTGKSERPKKPALLLDEDLKYAQVVKNKQGKKLQQVEKRIIFSQNTHQSEILMILLERQNLTVDRAIIGFQGKQ